MATPHLNSVGNSQFQVNIGGAICFVEIDVRASLFTVINLQMGSRTYSGEITKWSGGWQTNFLTMFHQYTVRDAVIYGQYNPVDGSFVMSVPQKVNAVKQAVVDVLKCIDAIFDMHQRGIIDYAIWYREKHSYGNSYPDYIKMLACHTIIHMNLYAPNATYKVVNFVPQ